MTREIVLVGVDILVIVGFSVAIGAWAPRWPASWLDHDAFPLRTWSWETPARYRRLGVPSLARRLPELGGTFGGESKSQLRGSTVDHLRAYRQEVRRAEWVHWLSIAVSLVLFAFNPWWLATVFVTAVFLGNLPFILVLRNNRIRLARIIDRNGSRP